MADSARRAEVGPVCPQCGTPIKSDWDWCHHCGFDPDGFCPLISATGPTVGSVGASPNRPIKVRKAQPVRAGMQWGPRQVALAAALVALLAGSAGWYVLSARDPIEPVPPAEKIEPGDWKPFSPPDKAFAVDLPGEVRTAVDQRQVNGDPIAVTSYVGARGNVSLFVAVYPMRMASTDVAKQSEAVVDSLAMVSSGQKRSVRATGNGRPPGADFVVSVEGGEVRGSVYVTVTTAYLVGFNAPSVDQASLDHLRASFTLLGPGA